MNLSSFDHRGGKSALQFDPHRILPDRDFEHRIGVQSCDITDVFRGSEDGVTIHERVAIIERNPDRHLGLTEQGEILISEAYDLVCNRGILNRVAHPSVSQMLGAFLGGCEQDLVFMRRYSENSLSMEGACVAFPSHWDPPSKLGLPLEAIHQVVPGLQRDIGRNIDQFIQRMSSDRAYRRSNWGMSCSKERNNHPALKIPHLTATTNIDDISFRVEDQSLIRLPSGLLFTITLIRQDLNNVMSDPVASVGLLRALRTMPEDMARYKGLFEIRPHLISILNKTCRGVE